MASLRYTNLRFSRTSGNAELILVGVSYKVRMGVYMRVFT